MRVLVTGGTGFVGRNVVRQLRDRGHQAILLVRNSNSSRARHFARELQVELRDGDVTQAPTLKSACDSVDALIHLVGIISEAGPQTFESVHVEGTRNVVAAAKRCGVGRLVHMSALGTRPHAVARYHQSKWEAEQLVRDSGLGWTVFRPSIIYGPGDGFVNLFAKISRWSPVVPVIGAGRSKFQPIPVEAVAQAFVAALHEPQSVGRTLDLCGPQTLTLEEVIDAVLETTHRRRLKWHVPLVVARLQATVSEFFFAGMLGKPPPLSRDQIVMLQEDNVGDFRPAMELFGLTAPDFQSGIERHLQPKRRN